MEQIDDTQLPISYTLFSANTAFMDELKDEHDRMRRRLYADDLFVTSLTLTYGGPQAVEYLKALDEGRFEKSCKRAGRRFISVHTTMLVATGHNTIRTTCK